MAEFPSYRKDLVTLACEKALMHEVAAGQASRVNVAEAEEDAKSGFRDNYLTQEDTTKPHDKYILSPSGKRLGFSEVEVIIADLKKAGEKVYINHALICGLQRGIANYTNEVGFACYRHQVQMLAQKERLAVVFLYEALAYAFPLMRLLQQYGRLADGAHSAENARPCRAQRYGCPRQCHLPWHGMVLH